LKATETLYPEKQHLLEILFSLHTL